MTYGERTLKKVRERQEVEQPTVAADVEWFIDGDDFMKEAIPPREALVLDGDKPVFFRKSLNQVFAERGIGKSMITLGLVHMVLHGEDFLRYSSRGGYRVALIDAELPDSDLQERLKRLVKNACGRLKLMTPERLPGNRFPALSHKGNQEVMLKKLAEIRPDVVIIDSLSAAFKFDTNEGGADGWISVNDFLIRLRMAGYCVILVHHANKVGTQRGRSDGDDHLDVSIKLAGARGWEPGQPLEATWTFEKVRHGGGLQGFTCKLEGDQWTVVQDDEEAEVVKMIMAGKSVRSVTAALGISNRRYYAIKRALSLSPVVEMS